MSKKAAFEKAKRLGFTIHDEDGFTLSLEAPENHHFIGRTHEYAYDITDGIKDPFSGRTAWQDIIQDMVLENTEACDSDCEWWEA